MTEQAILAALREGLPFQDLPEVSVARVEPTPKGPLDVRILLGLGQTRVEVNGEIKNACTPKLVEEIAPWLTGMKALRPSEAFALICPSLSEEAQRVCLEKNLDFIDMAGNVSINVPGRFLLRRVREKSRARTAPPPYRDPFGGKSSRVVRVLLEEPKQWTLKEIAEELDAESRRNPLGTWDFGISLASASKTLRSLEEELLVRRTKSRILTPEPSRLLLRWADIYARRNRSYQRRSSKYPNPFGGRLEAVARGLGGLIGSREFAFTAAAAAVISAPYVDLGAIDVFVDPGAAARLRGLEFQPGVGPELRVWEPYDAGVFMYARKNGEVPVVSDIQTFLDLWVRGGRDSKEARFLLARVIEPRWERR